MNDGLSPPARVIGVVRDSRWAPLLRNGEDPMYYSVLPSFAGGGATLLVHSQMRPADIDHAVQAAFGAVAPSVPVENMESLRGGIDESIWQVRLLSRIIEVFTAVAFVLFAVGFFAASASSVADRHRELGIRIALGAGPVVVLTSLLRHSLKLGLVGVVLGLSGGAALSRLIASRVAGVGDLHWQTYGTGACFALAVVLAAALVPSVRATAVDVVSALRSE